MGVKNDYYIKPIDNNIATDLIIKYHYLHRRSPVRYSFGLFRYDAPNKIFGCVIYGTPASRFLQKGICGESEADNVIELTRLWVDDSVPRNGESFLIGQSLKYMRKHKYQTDIIVSFADTGAGHLGYIYQATNFYYTGINHIQKDWIVDGRLEHNRHFIDRFGSVKDAKKFYGNRMVQVERSVKHRYIYFNCGESRKVELLNKLKYSIVDYPKILPKNCERHDEKVNTGGVKYEKNKLF